MARRKKDYSYNPDMDDHRTYTIEDQLGIRERTLVVMLVQDTLLDLSTYERELLELVGSHLGHRSQGGALSWRQLGDILGVDGKTAKAHWYQAAAHFKQALAERSNAQLSLLPDDVRIELTKLVQLQSILDDIDGEFD